MGTDVEKAPMNELNAKWRNYMARIMGMDPTGTFQVAQGALVLSAADSSWLFNMSDAVPPDSAANYYDPSTMNRRSDAYRGLLFALQSESASDLKGALGDMYAKWIDFRNTWYDDGKSGPQEVIFESFADRYLDPMKAKQAITTFKKASLAPLNQAIDKYQDDKNRQKFIDPEGNTYSLYKYKPTIDIAKKAINAGATIDLEFNASKEDGRLGHTFAQGAASGFNKIFSGGAGVSFEKLNRKAAYSDIEINGRVGKYATIAVGPEGWYDSSEVKRGYNHKDDFNVWDPNSDLNWDNFFSQPNGSLARYITEILLVSDYDLTVRYPISFKSVEFNQIKTRAQFGIWPFYSFAATATHTTALQKMNKPLRASAPKAVQHRHNEDGSLSLTMTSPKGVIYIWGISFQNAP
jgi:hypothetical protein